MSEQNQEPQANAELDEESLEQVSGGVIDGGCILIPPIFEPTPTFPTKPDILY